MLRTVFPVIIDNPFKNCRFVHPMQQRNVAKLIASLAYSGDVKYAILFGSSVTRKCHVGSDIDVFVESESQHVDFPADCPVDLWTRNTVNSQMLAELLK